MSRSAAVALAALLGCSATPREHRTLVVGRPADALRLDPAQVTDGESAEVCEQIFEHLTRFKKGGLDVEPALAERWEPSPSGKEWTFYLRRGVRFHDGTEFNADAVVFSFQRQRDPQHGQNMEFGYRESTFRHIQEVTKLDAYTVRITLNHGYSSFLADLATFQASIVSPEAVRRYGSDFHRHPVGTGPFRFVEWSEDGGRITLAANPSYWGGAPHLEHLVFTTIRDPRQRLVALEGGAIDVAEELAPQDLQFVALHPELRAQQVPGINVAYLAINTAHPPFDDVRVRRAINHAINRRPLVKFIYQGLGEPATGPLAPGIWKHFRQPDYPFDPALARRLLAEAGYDPGLRPKFFVTATPRPFLPGPESIARAIASNLRDVGIAVEMVVNPINEHLDATAQGLHDLCLNGWIGDSGDARNFLYVLFDSDNAQPGFATNVAFLRDRRLHELLQQAQETRTDAERDGYYAEALLLIHDQAPWVPLAHSSIVVASRARVLELEVSPSGMLYFRDVTLTAP